MVDKHSTSGPTDVTQNAPVTRVYTVRICDDCYALRGEMCHTPECVFCRRTMSEVGHALDMLLIRPIVDGERLDLHPPSERESRPDVMSLIEPVVDQWEHHLDQSGHAVRGDDADAHATTCRFCGPLAALKKAIHS